MSKDHEDQKAHGNKNRDPKIKGPVRKMKDNTKIPNRIRRRG